MLHVASEYLHQQECLCDAREASIIIAADFDPSVFVGTMFNRRTAQRNHAARWVAWDQFHLPEVFVGLEVEMTLWVERHRGSFDVEIEDISDKFGVLAMQGPKSLAVLEALIPGEDWQSLRFARGRRATLPGGAEIYVASAGARCSAR